MYVCLDSSQSIKMLSFEKSTKSIEFSMRFDIDFSERWISAIDPVEQ